MIDQILLISIIALKIIGIIIALLLSVAYLTFFERKVIGFMQNRIGPNRVGPLGLLQPIADVFKLLNKEVIIPSASNQFLFVVAPIISIGTSLAAWAAIPLDQRFVLANINAGVLYIY